MLTKRKLDLYISIAEQTAMLSKDSTKVGAIILGPNEEVRSIGYNGFPRGVEETESRIQRPEKYFWTEHAERNAIYNAARIGTPLAGSSIICTKQPCSDCCRAVIQAGLIHIYAPMETEVVSQVAADAGKHDWTSHSSRILEMLREANVGLSFYERSK